MRALHFCRECELAMPLEGDAGEATCECGQSVSWQASPKILEGAEVDRCAVCGYDHIHRRKDFPRALGLGIIAFAAVSTFWMPGHIFFLPLILASLLDLALFQVLPWKLSCYVCSTEYYGIPPRDDQEPWDLEKGTEYRRLRWPKKAKAGEVEV